MKILLYFRRQLNDDLVIVRKNSRCRCAVDPLQYPFCGRKVSDTVISLDFIGETRESMAFVRLGQRSMRHPPVGCPLPFLPRPIDKMTRKHLQKIDRVVKSRIQGHRAAFPV